MTCTVPEGSPGQDSATLGGASGREKIVGEGGCGLENLGGDSGERIRGEGDFLKGDADGRKGCVGGGECGKGIDRGRGMWKNDYDMCTEEDKRWRSGLFL